MSSTNKCILTTQWKFCITLNLFFITLIFIFIQIEDNNKNQMNETRNTTSAACETCETPETVVSWMARLAGMTSMTPRLCRHLLTRCRTSPSGCQSTVSLSKNMPEELSVTALSVSKRQLSSTTGRKVSKVCLRHHALFSAYVSRGWVYILWTMRSPANNNWYRTYTLWQFPALRNDDGPDDLTPPQATEDSGMLWLQYPIQSWRIRTWIH